MKGQCTGTLCDKFPPDILTYTGFFGGGKEERREESGWRMNLIVTETRVVKDI